jgi:uncharacterized glyoxalase superfamily protein PhnB
MVWSCFSYDDAPAAIRFLTEVVGFEATLVVEGDERAVAHAELRWPSGGGVMLGSAAGADGASPVGAGAAYVVTDDPDALFERVTAAGATVVRELHDEDFGSRTFSIADPEGNRWTFGTYGGA